MQKVRNSKTLPKDRKLIELRGLNETLTNLQIERVELLNEFDEGDKKPSAKVGLSSEMSKKIANEKKILEEMVNADERVLKDPAPVVKVHELADSSVNLICRPWVNSADYWGLYWDMMEKVKLRFDEEGIEIPFPQVSVHMEKDD